MFLSRKKDNVNKSDIRTKEGFSALYATYLDYVFYICYSYTEDEIVSEEITSELFSKIWERREDLYQQTWEKDSWKHYLSKAAKHRVYDYLRSKKREAMHLSKVASKVDKDDNTTEKEIFFSELAEQVSYLTNQLPPRCKEVYQLSRDVGLSNKEIAKRLLISDNAVKKQIAKALNYLRENLEDYKVPKRATST